MAEHGSEPHARLLVTGDGKCHDRKIQHKAVEHVDMSYETYLLD